MSISRNGLCFFIALIYPCLPALAQSTPSKPAEQPPQFTPVSVENESTHAKATIERHALALLSAQKYSELDALAEDFRKSGVCFEDGTWKLNLFYQAVSDLGAEARENDWETRLALLRHWFEKDTECITPRVAMARALVGYAWHARGDHWASEVPKDAWNPVSERVKEAYRILEAARALPEKCPGWYSAWMKMAMLAGTSREQYDQVFEEGLKSFPSYTPLYFSKTWYLLERWYGKRGEWESFAANSANTLGGEEGDILYAQIVWYVHDSRFFGNPIRESAIEWARVQRGFEAIRRSYPNSIFALNEYCAISGFAPTNARQRMRSLFAEIGNRADLRVWRTMEIFQRHHNWAFSN